LTNKAGDMKKILHFLMFLVLTLSAQSFAGNDKYICTIQQVQALHSSGSFNTLDSIVASDPPDTEFQYVYIREFTNGPKKPFWGTDDGDKVLSGLCK
jgi:hypothetical protein